MLLAVSQPSTLRELVGENSTRLNQEPCQLDTLMPESTVTRLSAA